MEIRHKRAERNHDLMRSIIAARAVAGEHPAA
jgi:hypothetical protein